MENNKKTILNILGLLPLMMGLLIAGQTIKVCVDFNLAQLFLLFGYIYLLPPLLWRLLSLMLPAQLGPSKIYEEEVVNGWLLSYQLQQIYNALPLLENVLKVIPGLYSSWLRLWGANIGNNVKWSFKSAVSDRPFISIENDCEIEEKFCSHSLHHGQFNLKIVIVKKI